MSTPVDIEDLINQYREGKLTGVELKGLEEAGTISKSERRKVVKKATAEIAVTAESDSEEKPKEKKAKTNEKGT